MTLPISLAFLWLIAANLIGMLPTRDKHWRAAYLMIAIGVPLLGWLTWASGPIIGLVFLAAAGSILRWPVYFLGRWLRQRLGF